MRARSIQEEKFVLRCDNGGECFLRGHIDLDEKVLAATAQAVEQLECGKPDELNFSGHIDFPFKGTVE